MKIIAVSLSLLVVLAFSASAVNADVITVTDWGDSQLKGGYAATYNYGATASLGASTDLGSASSATCKMIVGFDLAGAGITSGTVTSASLSVRSLYNTGTFYVYRGTGFSSQNWVEGTGTGQASTTAVSYNKYDGVNTWTTAGGDYDISVVATGSTTATKIAQTVIIDVTALVQSMINAGNTRATFFILSNTTGSTCTTIGSKEQTTASFRPVLTVDYTSVPEPTTMTLLALSGLSLLARRRRNRA